ncbi:YaeQ protein family [Burkholderia thailandensis E264]|uniref:YaeQ protein family n=2 Tax=Burkholderia thailandensis TaxID=57975 RepID=Q2T2L9_BURTA|nr:YaeQ protein family [Burkholderia thailandensis E264]
MRPASRPSQRTGAADSSGPACVGPSCVYGCRSWPLPAAISSDVALAARIRYHHAPNRINGPRGLRCRMALKSTIYKAELQIADMDRHYYADHSLTVARHPSETDERMMVRIAAFALFAHERLEFCKGLSDIDEPDLWQKDLTGAIEAWIDVGQPDERRIAKASGRADRVNVIAYGGRTSDIWWQGVRGKVERLRNVQVTSLAEGVAAALGGIAERTMRLQCTIQDGGAWLSSETHDPVAIEWTTLKAREDA